MVWKKNIHDDSTYFIDMKLVLFISLGFRIYVWSISFSFFSSKIVSFLNFQVIMRYTYTYIMPLCERCDVGAKRLHENAMALCKKVSYSFSLHFYILVLLKKKFQASSFGWIKIRPPFHNAMKIQKYITRLHITP